LRLSAWIVQLPIVRPFQLNGVPYETMPAALACVPVRSSRCRWWVDRSAGQPLMPVQLVIPSLVE
jgi:hypothetical protein